MNRRDLEKLLGAVQEVLTGAETAAGQRPDDGLRTMLGSVNRALQQVTRPEPPRNPPPPPRPPQPPTPPPRTPVDVEATIVRAVQQVRGRAPTPAERAMLLSAARACVAAGGSEVDTITTLTMILRNMPDEDLRNYPPTPQTPQGTPPKPPPPQQQQSSTEPEPITNRRIHFRKDPP